MGLVNQRDQGREVSRIGAELLGNDDLMRGINRDLTIIEQIAFRWRI